MKRTTWLTIGSAWLAAGLAACAPQKPAPPPVVVQSSLELTAQPAPLAPTRDPALRQIDPARDAAKLERMCVENSANAVALLLPSYTRVNVR